MSTPNLEQLNVAQKIGADALLTLIRSTCNGIERLTALNVAATRDFLSDAVSNTQQFLALKDASELPRVNAALLQPTLEKGMNYIRDVYEVTAAIQKDITAIAEGQYEQISRNAAATLDKTSATPGNDVVAATVKTLLDTSSRFFDQINSFSQQANAIAEANLKAVSATTRAAAAVTQKNVKK